MNKTMLYTALLAVLSTPTYADTGTQPQPNTALNSSTEISNQATQNNSPSTNENSSYSVAQSVVKPAADSVIKESLQQIQLAANTTTSPSAPTSSTENPTTTPKIDCNYRIPPETTKIEPDIITKWAENAALQSFDFDNKTIDQQLINLKSCFTDQGWKSFDDALQKTGNINAIKTQKLVVSSKLNGKPTTSEIKDNQWKVTVPLQVVYQNDKEKLTQQLSIDLFVGRKISGDLGIMQLIAAPMKAETPIPPTSSTDSTTSTN